MITAPVHEHDTKTDSSTSTLSGSPSRKTSAGQATIEYFTAQLHQHPKELPPMTVHKALFYIAQSAEPESAALVLSRIASDKQLDAEVRRDAINALGLIPTEFSDEHLSIALKEANHDRETAALRAMALSGGMQSLKALRRQMPIHNTEIMRLRAYAEMMIALRLKKDASTQVQRTTFLKPRPLKVVELSDSAIRDTLDSMEGKPPMMTFSDEIGFSLNCINGKHTILFNATFRRGALIKHCMASQIAGVITIEDKHTRRHVLRYSILLQQEKDCTRVSVVSTTGEVALTGELYPEGDGLDVLLRDVGTEIGPIQIGGIVRDNYIELNAEVYNSAQDKRDARSIN
jgi:hypothetical protein